MVKYYDIIIPMRILILGNNHSAESFYHALSKNKEDIVFSNCSKVENNIKYYSEVDIVDFVEANEINFILTTDENYMTSSLQEKFNSLNISNFSPTEEAINITKFKSYAKKFINKNKFLSPKYFIAERSSLAFDYLKTSNYPLAIRPDVHNFQECSQFAETYIQAQKIINNFFDNGNKKIVLEDYIFGKNFVIWAISDGYGAKIIGSNAKYQNNIGYLEPEFLSSEIKENLLETVINPTISSLAADGEEYIGILGFDFILNSKNEAYLVGFNSFFDDISVDLYTENYDLNWTDVFESCIVGDIFSKFDFECGANYALTIRNKDKINFIDAKIKSNLEKYAKELGYDTKEYEEATKLWKY